jgi:hypothetical protein
LKLARALLYDSREAMYLSMTSRELAEHEVAYKLDPWGEPLIKYESQEERLAVAKEKLKEAAGKWGKQKRGEGPGARGQGPGKTLGK